MISKTVRLAGTCLAVLAVSACVDIQKSQLKTEENIIDRKPKVVNSPRFAADVQIKGSILRVVVTPQCSIVEEETVERTEVSDKTVNGDARAWMTALSIAGALPLMGGTAMLADAPNVYSSDLNGREYNETGQEVVIGLGTALAALGLACVLPPMVNALRAVGSTETKTTAQRLGPVVQERVPCNGVVMPTYSVVARFSTGHAVPLGGAQPNNEFDVDLRQALGSTILGMSPQPSKVAIWINDKFQGELPTDAILDAARSDRDTQDEAAWKAAEPSACERSPASCTGVQSYLNRFPNGKHAEDARKLLQPRTNTVATGPASEGRLNKAVDSAVKAMNDATKKASDDATKTFDAALERAEKDAKKVCERECAKACEKDLVCRDACIVQVCP